MLHKEPLFEINNSNRLGTTRIDWYDKETLLYFGR